jgi:hypothetical protein
MNDEFIDVAIEIIESNVTADRMDETLVIN